VARRFVILFIIAFLLNFAWEEAHSVLYTHYKDGPITHAILLHASLFDATVITFLGAAFLFTPALRKRMWLVLVIGFIFAVLLELFALHTNRWAYTGAMPVIPILKVGLTPSMQLALLGYLSIRSTLILSEK
jgi:hypothetical protein